MNEISLHRGRSPHLTSVDAYVDGQHLTAAVVRPTYLADLIEAHALYF